MPRCFRHTRQVAQILINPNKAYVAKLAVESTAQLLLVHVIADSARGVPLYLRDQFYRESEDGARAQMQKLARKHRLDAKMHRTV